MIRVLIADDHNGMRNAFAMMLNQQDGIHVVDDVPDGRSAVARLMQSGIDVALIDMMMPDMEGDEVIRAVMGGNGWKPRMVIYSGFVYADLVRRALDAGACGYLDKVAGIPETVTVIRAVARGEMCLCPSALEVVGEDVVAEAAKSVRADQLALARRMHGAPAVRVAADQVTKSFKAAELERIIDDWPWDVKDLFTRIVSSIEDTTASVEDLYKSLDVQPRYIPARYRRCVGLSPKSHQVSLRLGLADRMLAIGLSQTEAALEAGFTTLAAMQMAMRRLS